MPAGRIWLVIPTLNEAENVERIVRAAAAQLERIAPGEHRLLVVDDHSKDGTGEIVERLGAELGTVEVLRRRGRGLAGAYLAGFEHALAGGAELVIVMDADYSHDPKYLPALVEAAAENDLVLGSRYVKGGEILDWPRLRRFLSRGGSRYARWLLGVEIRDLTGGYRCIRREVLEAVEPSTLRSQGYVFNIELTYRTLLLGYRVAEVPIVFQDRTIGKSKISLPIALEALLLVPALRFQHLQRKLPAEPGARRRGRLMRATSSKQPPAESRPPAAEEAVPAANAGAGHTGTGAD